MELMKNAWRQVWRRRSRSWMTVCGIAVGVMMVSVVSVIGNVGKTFVDRELDSMGMSGLSVMALSADVMLTETALEEIRELSQVESAMPLMVEFGKVSSAYAECESVLCGIDAGAGQVISLTMCYGRQITQGDVVSAAPVCVLDEAVARTVYGRTNVVGKTVTVKAGDAWQELTVVGVTRTGSSLLQDISALIPGMIYLPYTSQRELTGRETFDQIAVRTVSPEATDQTKRRIEAVLERLYEQSEAFRTDNLAVQKDRLGRLVDVVTTVLTVLSGVSLLVSGFGIMTAMLSSVSERTREVGIKKAIGATRGRILSEFLSEAMMVSLLGAILGIIPAVVVALVLGGGLTLLTVALLVLFSLTVGVVFGVYPAYKAANLPPVEALRSE